MAEAWFTLDASSVKGAFHTGAVSVKKVDSDVKRLMSMSKFNLTPNWWASKNGPDNSLTLSTKVDVCVKKKKLDGVTKRKNPFCPLQAKGCVHTASIDYQGGGMLHASSAGQAQATTYCFEVLVVARVPLAGRLT